MDTVRFFATDIQPNPVEVDYWIDLSDNPYGAIIKYWDGTEWSRLAESGGNPELVNYYTKVQVNALLNGKASVESVESKVDDEEAKDVVKGIQFRTSLPDQVQMTLLKYDDTTVAVSLPIASDYTSGVITSEQYKNLAKQVDISQLYQDLYESTSRVLASIEDVKQKYQRKLKAGKNIRISEDNVISTIANIEIDWGSITDRPLFSDVATSGDYNDLINKLTPGNGIKISDSNVISSDVTTSNIDDLQTKLNNEITRATTAEKVLDAKVDTKANKDDVYTKKQVDDKLVGAYKVKGSSTFEDLPSSNTVGDIYNITNDFTLNGEPYMAGTNIVWTEDGWDPLSGSFDTTAIEQSIQNVASDLDEEIANRLLLDNRVQVAEGKLNVINGDSNTPGSISKALKDANTYTDNSVASERSRAQAAEKVNADNISVNTQAIANNASAIATNASNIAANTSAIYENSQDIEANTQAILKEISDRKKAITDAIDKEVTDRDNAIAVETNRAMAVESQLADDIAAEITNRNTAISDAVKVEKDRAEEAESTITNNLSAEITRAKAAEKANTDLINKEITDRQNAISTEITNRNAAIDVEKQRAMAAESSLDTKITNHVSSTNTALNTKADKSNTYTKIEVDSKISTLTNGKQDKLTAGEGIKIENNIISSTIDTTLYKVVSELPTTDIQENKIYLIHTTSSINNNVYTEYIYVDGKWEILGDFNYDEQIDLTTFLTKVEAADTYQPKGNYALKSEIPNISGKADKTYVDSQISTVNNEVAKKANKADLATVATSGSYNDLTNKLKAGSGLTITSDNTLNVNVDLTEVTDSIDAVDSKIDAEITRAKAAEATKVDKVTGKGLSTNDYTTAEKNKLANLGNHISKIDTAGTTTGTQYHVLKYTNKDISTGSTTDSNVIIAAATQSLAGVMTANDKKKLDGIAEGANATTYTFANGTDGSFTVTPTSGTAQKVSIGKPAYATEADRALLVRITNSEINKAVPLVYGTTAGADSFILRVGNTGNDQGYGEIATGDNGNEPIYVRQYDGNTITNSITLLDPSGNTLFPNTVTANKFIGPLQGTADNASKLGNLTFSLNYNDLINDNKTQTITDTSNSTWFVKVTGYAEWNTSFFSLYLDSSYDNNSSKLAVQIYGITGFNFYRSRYNSLNITKIGKTSAEKSIPILYLQMAGSTNAKLTVSSSRTFTLEKVESIPDDIQMLDTKYDEYQSGTIAANSIVASNLKGSLLGNSDTATKLATARSINGTNFDGSANITTANWGTARNITIGKTAKSVNGSANVSWSTSEIANNATTTADGWMSKEDKQAISSMSSDFYGREQVTVQLKKGSTNFAGSITIKNKDNNEVIATSTTGNLTARIIYGVRYVISVPDVEGYYQNTVLEYTASQSVRNIDVVYNTLVINTITIDMTITDPATMISGDVNGSVIQNIRNNTHRYAAKNAVSGTITICQLDDSNSNLFHSGESSAVSNLERFVRIPRFYYKVDDTNPNIQKISFSMNRPNSTWQEWDGNDLIGCYEAIVSTNKIYSYSGSSSASDISYTQFKQFASARGTGYRLVTWQQHCMVAILFYAIYGHTNCQAKVGSGTSSYAKATGHTDSIGMADTVAGGNGDSDSINFLGLENWWGNKYEFVDNIRYNYTNEVSQLNFSIQEYDGTWRHVQVGSSQASNWKYPVKLRIGNKLDMIPFDVNESSGSTTTGFCDGQYYSTATNRVVLRSCHYSSAYGGVAYLDTGNSDSDTNSNFGSRLAFRGNIIEEKNVQTFLSL